MKKLLPFLFTLISVVGWGQCDVFIEPGPLALPGRYSVELWQADNGVLKQLVKPTSFEVEALENSSLDRQTAANIAFKRKVQKLRRKIQGSSKEHAELNKRIMHIKQAIQTYPGADLGWMTEIKEIENASRKVRIDLWGDHHKSKRDVETVPGTGSRIENIVWNTWYSTSDPTTTNKEQYELAQEEYSQIRNNLDGIRSSVATLESKLDGKKVPYTPQRPNWKEE